MNEMIACTETRRWVSIVAPEDLDRHDLSTLWGFQTFARNHLFMAAHDAYYASRLGTAKMAVLVDQDQAIGYAILPPTDKTAHAGYRTMHFDVKAPLILGRHNMEPADSKVSMGPSGKGPPSVPFPAERAALIRHWNLNPVHPYSRETPAKLVTEKVGELMKPLGGETFLQPVPG